MSKKCKKLGEYIVCYCQRTDRKCDEGLVKDYPLPGDFNKLVVNSTPRQVREAKNVLRCGGNFEVNSIL